MEISFFIIVSPLPMNKKSYGKAKRPHLYKILELL